MISFRQADLLMTLNPTVECRLKIYTTRDGFYFYDIDPKGYAFDKVKPLQDKIDEVMSRNPNMEKVAVGWMTTRYFERLEMDLIKILQGNSHVKNLHKVRLNDEGVALDFEYHP